MNIIGNMTLLFNETDTLLVHHRIILKHWYHRVRKCSRIIPVIPVCTVKSFNAQLLTKKMHLVTTEEEKKEGSIGYSPSDSRHIAIQIEAISGDD